MRVWRGRGSSCSSSGSRRSGGGAVSARRLPSPAPGLQAAAERGRPPPLPAASAAPNRRLRRAVCGGRGTGGEPQRRTPSRKSARQRVDVRLSSSRPPSPEVLGAHLCICRLQCGPQPIGSQRLGSLRPCMAQPVAHRRLSPGRRRSTAFLSAKRFRHPTFHTHTNIVAAAGSEHIVHGSSA